MDHLQKLKKEFKEMGDTSYIYKNELDKACFQHAMGYGDFKDLKSGTFSDKVLRDKAFNIAKNPKYDRYERGLASVVYTFFDKKSAGSSIVNNDNNNDYKQINQLLENLKKEKNILHLEITFGALI